jgi:hypothetical protein
MLSAAEGEPSARGAAANIMALITSKLPAGITPEELEPLQNLDALLAEAKAAVIGRSID